MKRIFSSEWSTPFVNARPLKWILIFVAFGGTALHASNIHDSISNQFKSIFADPEKERNNLLSLLQVERDIHDTTLSLIYRHIGITYGVQSNNDSAEYYFMKAAEHVPKTSQQYLSIANNLGNVYRNSGNLKKSMAIYYEILPIATEHHPDFLDYVYSGLSSTARLMNLREEALDYLLKAFHHLKEKENTTDILLAIENQKLANLHYDLKRFDEAIYIYLKILPVFEESGRMDVYNISLGNLAISYMEMGEFHKADSLLSLALEGVTELGQAQDRALILQKRSILHEKKGDIKKSLAYAEQAVLEANGNQSFFFTVIISHYIHTLIADGQYQKALQVIKENEERIGDPHDFDNIEFFNQKAEALFLSGRYKEAYETMSFVKEVNNAKQETMKEYALFNAMEAHKNEILQEQQVILQKEIELQNRRQLVLVILFALLLTIIVYQLIISHLRKKTKASEEKLESEKSARIQMELDALREKEESKKQIIEQQKIDLLEAATKNITVNKQIRQILGAIDEKKPMTDIRKQLVNITKEDPYWKTVVQRLQATDQEFFARLVREYPQLTSGDLELCALVRIGLSYKEIAELLNISHESVYTKKYRLSKKIDMEDSENFQQWVFER